MFNSIIGVLEQTSGSGGGAADATLLTSGNNIIVNNPQSSASISSAPTARTLMLFLVYAADFNNDIAMSSPTICGQAATIIRNEHGPGFGNFAAWANVPAGASGPAVWVNSVSSAAASQAWAVFDVTGYPMPGALSNAGGYDGDANYAWSPDNPAGDLLIVMEETFLNRSWQSGAGLTLAPNTYRNSGISHRIGYAIHPGTGPYAMTSNWDGALNSRGFRLPKT